MEQLINDMKKLVDYTIKENLPDEAVIRALATHAFTKKVYVVAIGKAAWNMANAAYGYLGDRIEKGIVITKYDHSMGAIPNMEIVEAGHPLSDENTILGTKKVIELAERLTEDDQLIFLVSGGGSALFEAPLAGITLEGIVDINSQLLAAGADIVEMNVIRKRLSQVKAGRFAKLVAPAKIFAIVLSDVLGDRLDSIASGPVAADQFTVADAHKIVEKYQLKLTPKMAEYLAIETPKEVDNVEAFVTGSVSTLCNAAAEISKKMGYEPMILSSNLDCEAREAGRFFASIAVSIAQGNSTIKTPCAVIIGGETVVNLKGKGKGGRNQEFALAAAEAIAGIDSVLILSIGSDGTDGPTDAAGGFVDGNTMEDLKSKGMSHHDMLENNDAYHALQAIDRLITTGPTGTNVNDVAILLYR